MNALPKMQRILLRYLLLEIRQNIQAWFEDPGKATGMIVL